MTSGSVTNKWLHCLNPLCSSDSAVLQPFLKPKHLILYARFKYAVLHLKRKEKIFNFSKVVNSRVDSLCVRFLFRCVCSVNFQLPQCGGQTNPRILLSDQCDSSKARSGLAGNADCESRQGAYSASSSLANISVVHMHADCSEASDWSCKCQLRSASQLRIPLSLVLSGNEMPKRAQYQLACVTPPSPAPPSPSRPRTDVIQLCLHQKLICTDATSHITVTIYPC